MEITPTVVVGLGEAGARMVSRVQDVVEAEGGSDELLTLALDTKTDEIDTYAGDADYRYDLNHPVDSLQDELPDRSYLNASDRLPPEGGAQKDRAIARLYLDSKENFRPTEEFFQKRIGEFVNSRRVPDSASHIDVWLVTAFGGGTGSGLFPLVSAMLNDVLGGIDINVRQRGVGTVPELSNWEMEESILELKKPPKGENRHYVNSYVALKELQGLLSDGETRIKVESKPKNLIQNEYNISGDVYDEYYLIGFDEGQTGKAQYLKQKNTSVAYLIYFFSVVEAAEDFPQGVPMSELSDLNVIDAGKIGFPAENVEEYFEYNKREGQIKNLLEDISEQQERFEKDRKYLNELVELSRGTVPDGTDHVSVDTFRLVKRFGVDEFPIKHANKREELKQDARETADRIVNEKQREHFRGLFSMDPINVSGDELSHIESISGGMDLFNGPLGGTVGGITPVEPEETESLWDRLIEFTPEDVVEYLYYDQFLPKIDAEIATAEREYEKVVSQLWEKHGDEFREQYASEFRTYSGEEPEKKAEGLKMFLKNWIADIREDGSGILGGFLGPDPDELRDDAKSIQSKQRELNGLREKRNTLNELRAETREKLLNRMKDLETGDDDLEKRVSELQARKTAAENQREMAVQTLHQRANNKFATMKLKSLDPLDQSTFAQIQRNELNLGDLIQRGILDRDLLTEDIAHVLDDQMEQQLVDIFSDENADPTAILGVLYSQKNQFDTHLNLAEIIDYQGTQANFDYVADQAALISDDTRISTLGVYSNADPENMSTYRVMAQCLESDSLRISEILTGTRDEGLDRSIRLAYAELVSSDIERQIEEYRQK